MKFIQKIVNKTKEPLSYISDLSQVLVLLYSILLSIIVFFQPFGTNLRLAISNFSLPVKVVLLLLLIAFLIYWLKKIYNDTRFIISSNKFSAELKTLESQKSLESLIEDYKKIVPSTIVVKEIFNEFSKRARRWSNDIYLVNFDLNIWVRRESIDIEVVARFFSGKKQSAITFKTDCMKIPKEKDIKPEQLAYETYMVEMKPFFHEKRWREFIVECLERIEHDIAGREFYLSIKRSFNVVQFYLDPGFIPHKSYTFYLKGGQMYADHFCKRLITSFEKNGRS